MDPTPKESAYGVLSKAVLSLGQPDFPAHLSHWLCEHVDYCFTVFFGYRDTARPLDLYDDFPADRRDIHVRDYQEGPYLLDPFYLASLKPVPDGLYRLRDLAPDRFYQGEYYRSYYQDTELAEEIGFFSRIDPQTVVVLSLMRTTRRFSAREFRVLGALAPIIDALQKQHWPQVIEQSSATAEHPGDGQHQNPIMSAALGQFAAGKLTAREREVVEFVLKGYSAEATGSSLGISLGTVRTHRRNVYQKMGIGSQGELFSRFLNILGNQ